MKSRKYRTKLESEIPTGHADDYYDKRLKKDKKQGFAASMTRSPAQKCILLLTVIALANALTGNKVSRERVTTEQLIKPGVIPPTGAQPSMSHDKDPAPKQIPNIQREEPLQQPDLKVSNNNNNYEVVSDPQLRSETQVCVTKNARRKCEYFPCQKGPNGEMIRATTGKGPFGYSGKFVHRNNYFGHERIKIGGNARWDSGCVVSHKYKFVYIHVLKSGGTAIKEFLRKSFCGDQDPDCKKKDRQVITPIGCQYAVKNYPDYFVFSFARNPFSRAYSMYSMTFGYPRSKQEPSEADDNTPEYTFNDFILNPGGRALHTTMSPSHYVQQTKFLFGYNNCPAFDFLGRVEHIDEDMKRIIDYVKSQEMQSYFNESGNSIKPVNTWGSNTQKKKIGSDLRRAYGVQQVIDTVAGKYKRDFELLGYDNSTVPQN